MVVSNLFCSLYADVLKESIGIASFALQTSHMFLYIVSFALQSLF